MLIPKRTIQDSGTRVYRTHAFITGIAVVATLVGGSVRAEAQQTSEPRTVRLWHGALVAGASITSMLLLDEPVRNVAQRIQSPGANGLAVGFRQLGEAWVVGPGVLSVLLLGLAADNRAIERTGKRLTAAQVLNYAITFGGKIVIGRERPYVAGHPHRFDAFSSSDSSRSYPSGHTSVAFALATTIADDVDRSGISIALYAAATGTALSRIYNDRHWLGDTLMGMAIGVSSAKIVSGRWRIFDSAPPGWIDAEQDTGRPAFIDVAAGLVGGALLTRFIPRLVTDLGIDPPTAMATPSGGLGIGWTLGL